MWFRFLNLIWSTVWSNFDMHAYLFVPKEHLYLSLKSILLRSAFPSKAGFQESETKYWIISSRNKE